MEKTYTETDSNVINEIIKDWDIERHIFKSDVMEDIKAAIENAYMVGCFHGRIDSDCFEEALKYLKVSDPT